MIVDSVRHTSLRPTGKAPCPTTSTCGARSYNRVKRSIDTFRETECPVAATNAKLVCVSVLPNQRTKVRPGPLLAVWAVWFFMLLAMGLTQPTETIVWAIVLFCTAVISLILLMVESPLGLILVLGFLQRVLWLWLDLQTGVPVFSSGADTEDFYATAIDIYNNPALLAEPLRLGMFSKPAALMFLLAGPHRVIVQFTNVLLGTSTPVLLARTLSMFRVRERTVNIVVGVMALMPIGAVLQSIFLREAAVGFFVAVSVYGFALYLTKGSIPGILLALGGLAAGSYFHAGVIGMAIGYLVAILLYDWQTGRLNLSLNRLVIAVPITGVFSALLIVFSDQFLGKFSNVESVDDIVDTAARSVGGSAYSDGGGGFSSQVFSRMLNFIGSPFPWQWRGLEDIVAFTLDASIFIALTVLVVMGLRSSPSRMKSLLAVFTVTLVGALFLFAVGTGNAGTAMRHRQKIIMPFAVAAALAFEARGSTGRKIQGESESTLITIDLSPTQSPQRGTLEAVNLQ